MPNAFAYLVLGLWPLFAVVVFRSLPPGRALLVSLFSAYLFLPPPPVHFDVPLFPALSKDSLPNLVVLVICLVMYRDRLRLLPENRLEAVTVIVFVLSPFLTMLGNMDQVFFGIVGIPGLGLKDGISLALQQFILIIPLLLARNFLQSENGQRDLLLAYCLFGLLYSIPMLVEVRLSPQLNIWIYGFFQHNFEQMIRFGGFRPIVFLYHGLWVAFFAMAAVCSSAILMRSHMGYQRGLFMAATLYMLVVLVLCKSAGSLLYAMMLLPLIVLMPRAIQVRVALGLVLFALCYPVIKSAGLLPEDSLLQLAARFSEERAASLQFRLDNESTLLARALERPIFGWGSWGRNQILDPITGAITTVTDGRWVIAIGQFGWVGFLAEMLLLSLPIAMLWAKTRLREEAIWSPYVGGMALLLAINVLDLLPNATLTPLTWLLAGSLLGYGETAQAAARHPKMKLRSIL